MDEEKLLAAAYRLLGAKQADEGAYRLLAKVLKENETLFTPRFVCALFAVGTVSPAVTLSGADVSFPGESIKKHLAGASHALLNAFTLGAQTDKRIKELSFSRPSESVALNAIASVYAEMKADELLGREREKIEAEGFETSFRFCPGYGDLPLSANADIGRALSVEKKIGLSVTEGGLLLPRKSIIGVTGVYPKKGDRK